MCLNNFSRPNKICQADIFACIPRYKKEISIAYMVQKYLIYVMFSLTAYILVIDYILILNSKYNYHDFLRVENIPKSVLCVEFVNILNFEYEKKNTLRTHKLVLSQCS